jgi:hypothetical protein
MINMRQRAAALLTSALALTSCGTANWYQGAKASGESQCRKQPPSAYEECMRGYDKTYNEYQKQREEAIQK